MKNSKFFLATALLLILSVFFSFTLSLKIHAAPAPWGIATNETTNQCGGYWGGDEFTNISLPQSWRAYYAEPIEGSKSDQITTPKGNCIFEIGMEQSCCAKLGYTYIGENVGIRPQTGKIDSSLLIGIIVCASCLCLLTLGGIGFLIYKKNKHN